jgi:D-arginine dehydrogenase
MPPAPDHFDIVVIGAGMAGASVACALAAERRVLLLEAEARPGYHATGRSAALFDEAYGNLPIRQLTVASREFLESPPSGFAEVPLLGPRGVLFIARDDQTQSLERFARSVAGLTALQPLDAGAIHDLVPVIRPGYAAAGMLDRGSMDLDVDAIHGGYLRWFRRQGGVLRCDAALGQAEWTGGLWHGTSGGISWTANLLINAAGAWADEVAVRLGARPQGLVPKRRTAIILDAPSGYDIAHWPAVIDVDEEFYFKPDAGRILASPADETPSPPTDAAPEEIDVATAAWRVEQCSTIPVAAIRHRWAGLRTFMPDRSPVIGFDPDLPQFFWLAGQGGYGIQTAPAIARLAASMVLGQALPPDLARLGFDSAAVAPRAPG